MPSDVIKSTKRTQIVTYTQYWDNQQNVDDQTAEVFFLGVTWTAHNTCLLRWWLKIVVHDTFLGREAVELKKLVSYHADISKSWRASN